VDTIEENPHGKDNKVILLETQTLEKTKTQTLEGLALTKISYLLFKKSMLKCQHLVNQQRTLI